VNAQADSPARLIIAGSGVAALGVAVALVTVLTLTLLKPVLLVFALGGLGLLIPTLVMRDPKAYWLFLLVLSIPFDISKRITVWLADLGTLYNEYGIPASGTLSLDLFLTDIVLFAMLLPWVAALCLRRERLYFSKIGYLFVLYLAWALIVSLIEAESFYLSICEWCREVLYFLYFVYLTNNVVTRLQFRSIVLALFVGLIITSASVITFLALDITFSFASLYGDHVADHTMTTFYETSSAGGLHTKRSAGIFPHPALAACFIALTLSIVLAHLTAARRHRDQILFATLFVSGCIASYMTFSRAGFAGLIAGSIVFFAVGRWSRLISGRAFAWSVIIFAMAVGLSAPLLIRSFESRPHSISRRWELIEITLDAYLHRPILGAGLNNSSVVIREGQLELRDKGRRPTPTTVPVHYLVVLTEVGLVGFLLFFAFFWQIVRVALRSLRGADTEMKLLLVGIVAGLASLATQNSADVPLGGHSTNALLWLFAGLIIAIARRVQAERALPVTGRDEPVTP
jgi:hypothetical protein